MAEVEIGGATIKGGKLMLLVPIVSALGGGLWGGFEFYKDYMDMKEIIQNIDTDAIEARNDIIETKLESATLENMLSSMNQLQKDTTSSLREVESLNRETEKDVRNTMRETEDRIDSSMRQLENKLTERLQEALDNPLSD